MERHEIINCPKCQQKLRVPSGQGLLNVRCPKCQNQFHWDRSEAIITADSTPVRRNLFWKSVAAFVVISAIGLLIYFNQRGSISTLVKTQQPKWITISYADLLDPNAIIRTGQDLKSALGNPQLKGSVQPFVDQYSFLLQHSLAMLSGSDKIPHSSVIEAYQVGSAQPAWVAILRGGRIHVTADNKNHARVFLLGDDPEKSYQDNYSVIRHCLNALTPSDGSPLNVDVYAYSNDYASSELRLNLNPYSISASSFPPRGVPLDLAGLAAFFNEAPEIQGAQLDRSKGLILYGKQGAKQTLAGANISLSDFAVAYRAVFHAGDNEAFISLDPHTDPTKVNVNFGGFLEDTRIGSVVLEADKRFKTITSGLDPNSFTDLRKYTRHYVPSFLSVAEQDLLDSSFIYHEKWESTRFWFYPDSIGVESDLNYQYALITNPQFMADAERIESKKSATLSPSIRRNIDHLNLNYSQYANAFSELKELTTVARVMGICSWLYKASPGWLDLDALLSVELPPIGTPREKAQLVSACVVSYAKTEGIDTDYVIKNASAVYLSPVLDKKVSEHFGNSANFAKFLCLKKGIDEENSKSYEFEASQLFNANRNNNVRDIIKTEKDLEDLATYSTDALHVQEPSVAKIIQSTINADKATLEKLEPKIDQIKGMIGSATSIGTHNDLVDRYNALVSQYESIRERYNLAVSRYNSLGGIGYHMIIRISGGINLEPRNFKITTPQTSAKLIEFRGIMDKVGSEWRSLNGSGKWIRNATAASGSELKNKLPKFEWTLTKEAISGGSTYRHIQADSNHQFWSAAESQTGSWRDCRKIDRDAYQERAYEAESKKLQIVEFHSGKLENNIIGQMDNTGRIVFRKSERQDILKPKEPPVWFSGN
jgi:phage FluMu protein Com